jgi:hypothetical protein
MTNRSRSRIVVKPSENYLEVLEKVNENWRYGDGGKLAEKLSGELDMSESYLMRRISEVRNYRPDSDNPVVDQRLLEKMFEYVRPRIEMFNDMIKVSMMEPNR